MQSPDDIIWHEYQPDQPLAAIMRNLLVFVCFGLPLIFLLVSTILPLGGILLLISFPFILAIAGPLVGLLMATAALGLSQHGITLRVLGPLTIEIPWAQLKHSSLWQTPVPAPVRWALLRPWTSTHAVYVPGRRILIPAGLLFGLGSLPVFIITPDHRDSQAIINRLEHIHHPLNKAARRRTAGRWRPSGDREA